MLEKSLLSDGEKQVCKRLGIELIRGYE